MTLLASVASLFCSVSACAAAPAVAVVPAENVNRVEIISTIIEDDAALDAESLTTNQEAELLQVADIAEDPADLTPDNFAATSDNELLLPADVILDDELLLPADVIVEGDDLLPADVIADIEADILPADVIADIDADPEVISQAEAESGAIAEANAAAPLFDEEVGEPSPTPPPAEEPAVIDEAGNPSGDGEAAS